MEVTKETAPDILLRRVNEARVALGGDELEELEPSMPAVTDGCILARNIGGMAWETTFAPTGGGADAVAEAWGTDAHEGERERIVLLPDDLIEATRMFDAAELLELVLGYEANGDE
jgi:hypothetical protein